MNAMAHRLTILLLFIVGCSSDVAQQNEISRPSGASIRDMSLPSPGALNIPNPSMGGLDKSEVGGQIQPSGGTQGGEMTVPVPQGGEGGSNPPSGPPNGGSSDSVGGAQMPMSAGEPSSPMISVQDCTNLHACLEGCMDSLPCIDRCRDLAGQDVGMAYESIMSCGRMNACNEPGGRWNAVCMAAACREPLEACFGEPNFPGQAPPMVDPPLAPESCGGYGQCLEACPANDQICRAECGQNANDASIRQWEDYQTCLSNAICGVQDHACRRRICENEFEACFERMIIQPTGMNSCALFNQCVAACPDDDRACEDICLGSTSPEGYNQSVELSLCLRGSNCADDDLDCIERMCLPQIEACFGQQPRGVGSCLELNTCLNECADGDNECQDDCVAATAPDEYAKFEVAIDCIRMNCPEGGIACERNQCGQQVEACLGDIPIPMGNNSCSTLNSCLIECADNDEPCFDRCIESATPLAFEQFIRFNDCLSDAQCADVDYACRRQTCAVEGRACLGRYSVPNGVLSCSQLNDCYSACLDNDDACFDACVARASAGAFNAHIALSICIQDGGLCEAQILACQ